ncbi:hypothetical protein D3C75_925940 [compost metagenome]
MHYGKQVQPIGNSRRVRVQPALAPGYVVAQPVVVQPGGIPFLAAIAQRLVAGFEFVAPGPPAGSAVGVVTFPGDEQGRFVQLQGAGAQMIGKTVAMLVSGNAGWRFSLPVQDLHRAASGLDRHDVQDLIGRGADFHARQVTGFVGAGQCAGVGLPDFSLTQATAVVHIKLAIVRFIFTNHLIDLPQLVAQIPLQGLSRL